MVFDPNSLPRDPDRLIGIIIDLQERNENLRGQVAALQRVVFGPRSERLAVDPAQHQLMLPDVEFASIAPPANDDGSDRPVADRHAVRSKAARNIGVLPKHLPRCEVVIEPDSKTCPCCRGAMHLIGEDVTEQLDVIPAILQVKRIRRPRYGCRGCEGAVVQAKAPARIVDNGLPTIALVTSIAVAKFAWHLPLNRQTRIFHGYGIALDRSTLAHWVMRAAWWLKPLHALLVETVLSAPRVFCDDTPMPVLDRRRRHTRTARFWSYAIDDRRWQGPAPPAVVYLFAEDRRGQHVHEHLTGFSGVLQVDGYAGYRKLTRPDRPGGAITLAFCFAHARRRFFEVFEASGSAVAEEALRRIRAVYEIEDRIRGLTAEERVRIRQAETLPILKSFKAWMMQRLEAESAKSSLAKAIRYTLGHWKGLTVFLADGRVEVDSNIVEREIRPIALGRRNALFSGSSRGAEAWAKAAKVPLALANGKLPEGILASIINTAKLHELDPQTYLADVLRKIVSAETKMNALHELLPWTWKEAQAAQRIAA